MIAVYCLLLILLLPALRVLGAMAGLLKPDFTIVDSGSPYLSRWHLTPWGYLRDLERPGKFLTLLRDGTRDWPSIRLHKTLRSDNARALHDHPWASVSFILRGSCREITPDPNGLFRWRGRCRMRGWTEADPEYSVGLQQSDPGTPNLYPPITRLIRNPGSWVRRHADTPHRLEILDRPCWSLFFTGLHRREWGFHTGTGWVHWEDFVE